MSKTNYVNLFRINALISFLFYCDGDRGMFKTRDLKAAMAKGQYNAPGLTNLVCYAPLQSLGSAVS